MYKIDFSSIPKQIGNQVHINFIPGEEIFARLHGHVDFCELFLVLEGALEHWVDGERERLAAGDCRLLMPGAAHRFTPSDRPAALLNLAFRPSVWQEFARRYPEESDPETSGGIAVHLPEREAELFREEAAAMLLEGDCPRRRLDLLLMLIWKNIQTRPGSGTTPLPEWLAAAMEQLRRLPADRQKPAVLFSLCGRTPDHVERVFRGCYGMTPGSFLRGRRLRRAAERIVFSSDKIAVIAASCGFENPGYFHREFKNYYGVTPRAYRQRHRTLM